MQPRDNGLRLRHFQESNHFGEFLSLSLIKLVGPDLVIGQRLAETLNPCRGPDELASKELQNHSCFALAITFLQSMVFSEISSAAWVAFLAATPRR